MRLTAADLIGEEEQLLASDTEDPGRTEIRVEKSDKTADMDVDNTAREATQRQQRSPKNPSGPADNTNLDNFDLFMRFGEPWTVLKIEEQAEGNRLAKTMDWPANAGAYFLSSSSESVNSWSARSKAPAS